MAGRLRTWQDDPLEAIEVETTGESGLAVPADVPQELDGRYASTGTELGAGGLGKVLSVHDHVIGREVALKVLAPSGAKAGQTRGLERRFLREARITAQLEHPGIVPVHDIGRRADGTVYYTMKRVRGRTLADALRECRSLGDRQRLIPDLLQVAHAVAYAHSRSIVHRDLKPENVMVGEFGETLVLDWGIARSIRRKGDTAAPADAGVPPSSATGQDGTRAPRSAKDTAVGTVMGTPAYMSPEQAAGKTDLVDARADVWSLGVMLYEILTGTQPFDGPTEQVLEDVRVGVVRSVLEVCPEAPADLAAVVERAMSFRRSDRYPSAREFAADVEAWLTGRRVQAYHYGRGELVRRFVTQNRAVITVVGLALVAVLLVALASSLRNRAERETAVASLAEALRARAETALPGDPVAASVFAAGSLALTETPAARGVAMYAARRWMPRLRAAVAAPASCVALAFAPGGDRVACAGGGKLATIAVGDGRSTTTEMPPDPLGALAVAADGTVWAGTRSGQLLRWDASGRPLPELAMGHPITALGLLADGPAVVAVEVADGGELLRLDATGKTTARLAWPRPVSELVVSDASAAGSERVWFVGGDDRVVRVDPVSFTVGVVPGPAGRELHTLDALGDGTVTVGALDGSTAIARLDVPPGSPPDPARSRRGLLRRGGSTEPDPAAAAPDWRVVGGENRVGRVRFASGGRVLVAARENGGVRLLDGDTLLPLADLPERAALAGSVAVAPDGATVAVAGEDGRLRIWALDASSEACGVTGLFGGGVEIGALALTPDGSRVITLARDGEIGVFDAATGTRRGAVVAPSATSLAGFTGPRRALLIAGGSLAEIDLETGEVVAHETGPITDAAFLGSEVLVLDAAGTAIKWSLTEGRELGRLGGTWRWLLPATPGTAVLEDAATGASIALDLTTLGAQDLDGPRAATARATSRDGRRLALAGPGGQVTVIDTANGRVLHDRSAAHEVHHVALSADGALVAAATARQEVVLWEVGVRAPMAVLEGHRDRVDLVVFDPAGRQLLTLGRDGDIRAWDLGVAAIPGRELAARAERDFGLHLEAGRLRAAARLP